MLQCKYEFAVFVNTANSHLHCTYTYYLIIISTTVPLELVQINARLEMSE